MLSKEQETFLASFADKALAEQSEARDRNDQIALEAEVKAARQAKRAELEAEAKVLVDEGMEEFETTEVPKIKLPA